MGTRPTVRAAWGIAVALVGVGALSACGPARRPSVPAPRIAAPSVSPSPPTVSPSATQGPITRIVLERVPIGPAYDMQVAPIVLRRPAGDDPEASAAFARLSRFLEESGFFARRSGYVEPRPPFPTDGIPYLLIKVTRGGRTFQVWNFNGERDEELSATEDAIRRASRLMWHLDTKRHHPPPSRDRH